MPWLPIYATEEDLKELLNRLSAEEELAFLVSNGQRKWKAVKALNYETDQRFCLWHVPSGRLPLLQLGKKDNGVVEDPWIGWTEERTGANSSSPYFGAGHPGIIWLNARANSRRIEGGIGLSSFEWIGNRYSRIGSAAPETTEKYWKRLGRLVKKEAARIPRSGSWDGPSEEIWALPHALRSIKSGTPRDNNP
jgi:hypothetical protein